MDFLSWNESMSVNIEEIDNQHKEFIGIINTLFEAMKVAKGYEVLDDVLNKLVDYAHYHFNTEEKYFEKFEYSDSQLHKVEHKKFFDKIVKFKKALTKDTWMTDEGDMILAVELFVTLRNWFANHVLVFDKKYMPLFKEKGLE